MKIKLQKLIAAGRLDPVTKLDSHGIEILFGWTRKKSSRKGNGPTSNQVYLLKKPRAFIDVQAMQEGRALTPGASLVVKERARQINAEGYDSDHDDAHVNGEIVAAAKCYLTEPEKREMCSVTLDIKAEPSGPNELTAYIPLDWPWEPKWWKPGPDRIRELSKAGALFLAESSRLQRLGEPHRDMEFRAKDCAQLIDDIYLVGVKDQ
jgi:hypothetical protein